MAYELEVITPTSEKTQLGLAPPPPPLPPERLKDVRWVKTSGLEIS